jgi:hypothetical protein
MLTDERLKRRQRLVRYWGFSTANKTWMLWFHAPEWQYTAATI